MSWLFFDQFFNEARFRGSFSLIHSSFRGLIRVFVEKWITFLKQWFFRSSVPSVQMLENGSIFSMGIYDVHVTVILRITF